MAMVTDAKPSGRAVCMARVARLDEESARQAREFFLDESILHNISCRSEAAIVAATRKTLLTLHRRGMAAYAGRDVAKLKSKGGKWKYVPSPFTRFYYPSDPLCFLSSRSWTGALER